MIRYIVSFPGHLTAEQIAMIREYVKDTANAKEWRDLVITMGGTITDLRPKPRPVIRGPRIVRAGNRSRRSPIR